MRLDLFCRACPTVPKDTNDKRWDDVLIAGNKEESYHNCTKGTLQTASAYKLETEVPLQVLNRF